MKPSVPISKDARRVAPRAAPGIQVTGLARADSLLTEAAGGFEIDPIPEVSQALGRAGRDRRSTLCYRSGIPWARINLKLDFTPVGMILEVYQELEWLPLVVGAGKFASTGCPVPLPADIAPLPRRR